MTQLNNGPKTGERSIMPKIAEVDRYLRFQPGQEADVPGQAGIVGPHSRNAFGHNYGLNHIWTIPMTNELI